MRLYALGIASIAAVAFAVAMLFQRTLYGMAFCLLVCLLQVAALFFLLGAPLLGFLQVILYAGAVMVMIVVAIMATPPRLRRLWSDAAVPRPLGVLLLAAVLIEFLALGLPAGFLNGSTALTVPPAQALPPWPTLQQDLASALFGPWALLTEAVAVLVFLSGLAVVEAWKPAAHPPARLLSGGVKDDLHD